MPYTLIYKDGSNFFGRIGQSGCQEVVELLNGRYQHALIGRVRRAERRTEGYHVQSRNNGTDDAAFQTGMYDLHGRLGAKLLFVGFHHGFQDGRLDVGIPTGVTATHFDLHPGHGEAAFQRERAIFLH